MKTVLPFSFSKNFFSFCLISLFCLFIFSPLFLFSRVSQTEESHPSDAAFLILKPVKLDSPRATMMSYLDIMKDYKKALEGKKKDLNRHLDKAARCFNLKTVPIILRKSEGRKVALLLKEVLDRVIVIDPEKIPEQIKEGSYWRLRGTEIVISKETEGEEQGHYLFSAQTTQRLEEFYELVKHVPYLKGTEGGIGYKQGWDKTYIPDWVQEKFFGLKKWQWVGLLLSLFIGFILKIFTEFVVRKMRVLMEKKADHRDSKRYQVLSALEKPIGLFSSSFFWIFSFYFLNFEGSLAKMVFQFLQVIFSFSVIWFLYGLVSVTVSVLKKKAQGTKSQLDDQLIPFLEKFVRILIVVLGSLIVTQNLGFNVVSLLAGLGLGGLALALAARDTVANLFGSVMILLDRPFRIGDWIITGSVEGNVESIGFRSTRVRTFYNSLVSIPNATLAGSNIDNMGQRKYRRVKTYLALTYDTSVEKMEKFLEGIKGILRESPYTRKDYFHVVFNEYGDSSLNVLLYFFLETKDWGVELKGREKIFLDIYKLAEKLEVKFAFPTQTLHVESLPEIDSKNRV